MSRVELENKAMLQIILENQAYITCSVEEVMYKMEQLSYLLDTELANDQKLNAIKEVLKQSFEDSVEKKLKYDQARVNLLSKTLKLHDNE